MQKTQQKSTTTMYMLYNIQVYSMSVHIENNSKAIG